MGTIFKKSKGTDFSEAALRHTSTPGTHPVHSRHRECVLHILSHLISQTIVYDKCRNGIYK